MPASGRRRQAATPWRQRMRWDLLAWGTLAGLAATLALGITGGGWVRAVVVGLLVVAASALLAVLATPPARSGGRRRGGSGDPAGDPAGGSDGPADGTGP